MLCCSSNGKKRGLPEWLLRTFLLRKRKYRGVKAGGEERETEEREGVHGGRRTRMGEKGRKERKNVDEEEGTKRKKKKKTTERDAGEKQSGPQGWRQLL